jgi:Protein of unknown function (DUF2924)
LIVVARTTPHPGREGVAARAATPSSVRPHSPIPTDVTTRLGEIARLDKLGLLSAWYAIIGTPPPAHCRAEFLRLVLAYRVQAQHLGGLTEATRRRLRRLAAGEVRPADAPPPSQNLKPGTRLLREWQGRTHSVTVTENGFAYDGQDYRSLSQIARTITGTRWSGPLFFGLRGDKRGDPTDAAETSS